MTLWTDKRSWEEIDAKIESLDLHPVDFDTVFNIVYNIHEDLLYTKQKLKELEEKIELDKIIHKNKKYHDK